MAHLGDKLLKIAIFAYMQQIAVCDWTPYLVISKWYGNCRFYWCI